MPQFHLIYGCMYSGKTTRLMSRCQSFTASVKVFKPSTDDRSAINCIETHSGEKMDCMDISAPISILNNISEKTKLVVIDEIQFFTAEIIETIRILLSKGIEVVAAGLYFDFRQNPFPLMPDLKNIAHSFTEMFASCKQCSFPANHTFRIVESKELILTGSKGVYEARCDSCIRLQQQQ